MAAARRMSKRHRAHPIPRLQRGAGRDQTARQGAAIFGGRSEQDGVVRSIDVMPGLARV